MANLSNKIELYANRKINFLKEVILRNDADSNGDYIAEWNLDIPKPTLEQLDAIEAQSNIVDSIQKIIATRKSLYGYWESQLEEIYDNGIDSWKNRIAQIKADHPKENS